MFPVYVYTCVCVCVRVPEGVSLWCHGSNEKRFRSLVPRQTLRHWQPWTRGCRQDVQIQQNFCCAGALALADDGKLKKRRLKLFSRHFLLPVPVLVVGFEPPIVHWVECVTAVLPGYRQL